VSVAFGVARRPRGRHVVAAEEPQLRLVPRAIGSSEELAAASFSRLRAAIEDVACDASAGEKVDLHFAQTVFVVCGDHGRAEAFRGRCARCGGYAMTLSEIEAHRRRVAAVRTGSEGTAGGSEES
jgi:hypothetical protein